MNGHYSKNYVESCEILVIVEGCALRVVKKKKKKLGWGLVVAFLLWLFPDSLIQAIATTTLNITGKMIPYNGCFVSLPSSSVRAK